MTEPTIFRDRFEQNVKDKLGVKYKNDVFLMLQETFHTGVYDTYTIEELLTLWGVHRHYDRLIERMDEYTQNHDDRMVIVAYDKGDFNVNHDEQKLLYFAVHDNHGAFISNGGALFQNGKLTFHT